MASEILLAALRRAWQTLAAADVPAAVAGGLALATWKRVRSTRDIDLLVGIDAAEVPRLSDAFGRAGIRPKEGRSTTTLGQLEILRFLYEPPETFVEVPIDLLVADSDYHRHALARRIPVQLADLDVEVAVLACEDLVLHKLLAGRLIDRADAAALLRMNRPSLDAGYLARWSSQLGLDAGLAEVWQEAFPGEQPPEST